MKKTGILFGIVGIGVLAAVIMLGREGNKSATDKPGRGMESADCTSCSGCSSDGVALSKDGTEPVPPDKESLQSVQSVEKPNLSDPVKSLLLQDGKKHNYPSLLAEINKLNYSLSSADMAALMDMLAWPNDRFPEGMRAIEINAVKNDVLDKLLRQEALPEGIGIAMAEMATDPNQDVVWRDYCVQFMQPFYERATGELTTKNTKDTKIDPDPSVDELAVIHDAMFQALNERGSTIAGTALIGLENLSRTHDEFDREEIVGKSVEIASDDLASTESRLTALRLAAGLTTEYAENTEVNLATNNTKNHENENSVSSGAAGGEMYDEVVHVARELAQTGDTVYMRSAAMVTLGEIGSDLDRELLQSYLKDSDRQIAAAAQQALNTMDDRANAPESVEESQLADTTPKPAIKQKPVLINQL